MTAETRLIKKYPNRRLYDMSTSNYIRIDDVKELVLKQVSFRIVDAKTNEDLTRSVLMQIIAEQESSVPPMFSPDLLAQIIRSYGSAMQGMMATYLDHNIHTFVEIQRRLQEAFLGQSGDNLSPSAELWNQFVKAQGPAIQSLMTSYLQQSTQVFLETQQQLQKQAGDVVGALGLPKFANPFATTKEEPKP
jgi:polyhydroxyalkanoate synthesis repressor PhaR